MNSFKEDGYVIVHDLDIPTSVKIEALAQTAAGLRQDAHGNKWIVNAPFNPCKLDGAFDVPELREIARHPRLLEKAREILGETELDTYISKFFPMIPGKGFSVDWHQDNFYIRGDSRRMVSCDVFINGCNPERGGLRLIPGSHRENFVHNKTDRFFSWINLNTNDYEIINLNIDKPFAIFFDINLVHGCFTNSSNDYRPSLAWEYKHRGYLPPTHNGHQSQDIHEI